MWVPKWIVTASLVVLALGLVLVGAPSLFAHSKVDSAGTSWLLLIRLPHTNTRLSSSFATVAPPRHSAHMCLSSSEVHGWTTTMWGISWPSTLLAASIRAHGACHVTP